MIKAPKTIVKPTEWVGSSKDDIRDFPEDVRRVMGVAIYDAQNGDEHPAVKALKGFGGRSILEVVDDFDGDTYRAVYTVKFAGVIYILHCFQKKYKRVASRLNTIWMLLSFA
jgi:phage-related protein